MDESTLRNVCGTVFNIQHYSIHDGPGIRTNVFLKGCPLRCLWCSNPESQEPEPQLMFRADRCTGCGACIPACPAGAISIHPNDAASGDAASADAAAGDAASADAASAQDPAASTASAIAQNDRTLCTGCGACVSVCPNEAREIIGEKKSAGDVFDEVNQDTLFYAEDGGVTLTGGETLAQPEFASAILKLCKNAGIHTAIETCGFANWDVLSAILQDTDLLLFDLKEMDPELHQKYTGVKNDKILENLKKANDQTDCEIWVRVPLIPGYNDDKENLRATARFVKDNLPNCTQVHLLPFHRLGEGKYQELEKEPNGFRSQVPDDAYMESLREYVRGFGLDCR